MENSNPNNNLNVFTLKQFKFVYDFYSYEIISQMSKKLDNRGFREKLSLFGNNIFNKIDNFTKSKTNGNFQNLKNFLYILPTSLLYMNIYNVGEILRTKIFYRNERMREMLINLYKVDFSDITSSVYQYLKTLSRTVKNIFKVNFQSSFFINRSLIYSMTYFPFLFKNHQSNGKISNFDYFKLFLISGICTIPIAYTQENKNFKQYIASNTEYYKKSALVLGFNRKFCIFGIKNIIENFGLIAVYLKIMNYFLIGLKESTRTLEQCENFTLLKESMSKNETLKRIDLLYTNKNDAIGKMLDYTIPMFSASFLISFFYSPFEFCFRYLMYNPEHGIKEMLKNFASEEKVNEEFKMRQLMVIRFKYLFIANMVKYIGQFGIVLYTYHTYYSNTGNDKD